MKVICKGCKRPVEKTALAMNDNNLLVCPSCMENGVPAKTPRSKRRPSNYMLLRTVVPSDGAEGGAKLFELVVTGVSPKAIWSVVKKNKIAGSLTVVCVRTTKTATIQETLILE